MALTSSLVMYDPTWIKIFEIERNLLLESFRNDLIAILHVGSTSVVGLTAKPEIDILVVVETHANLKDYSSKLEALGYKARGEEPGPPGHWYFSKNQNQKRTHKLHLCIKGHPCIEEQIIFRDYLRKNPLVAERYGELKLQLEQDNTKGIAEYISSKSPFIQKVIASAKASGFVATLAD